MPKGKISYKWGEIRWIQLDPAIGAAARKIRSCLIVQNGTMNQYGQLTEIIPFRPGFKKAPYVVNVNVTTTNSLDQDRFSDICQICCGG